MNRELMMDRARQIVSILKNKAVLNQAAIKEKKPNTKILLSDFKETYQYLVELESLVAALEQDLENHKRRKAEIAEFARTFKKFLELATEKP